MKPEYQSIFSFNWTDERKREKIEIYEHTHAHRIIVWKKSAHKIVQK